MQGYVKLTPDSLIQLVTSCMDYIQDFNIEPYKTTEKRWSWKYLMKINVDVYSGCPLWYQYKQSLINHFYSMYKMYENAKESNDEIWLSNLSYTHMVLLKDGIKEANPIYIMDY